jgi:hypothetical protein
VSFDLLELAAEQLGDVRDEVAFLGGASLVLWIDDPAAPAPRSTLDVDVIVVVDSRLGYYELGDRLRERGFHEDAQSDVICRWVHGSGLILDVMPTAETILGFTNTWYAPAVKHAEEVTLPSGRRIRAVTPPYLLATKLEAFANRGREDYLASVDFEDIVRLVDGRTTLVEEIRSAPEDLQTFLRDEVGRRMSDERFSDGVAAGLTPDDASQARRPAILDRLEQIVSG